MKKEHLGVWATISLFVVMLASVPASAQYPDDDLIEVDIPFTFIVGNTTLPAGKYIIEQQEPFDLSAMLIRTPNDRRHMAFLAEGIESAQTAKETCLLFNLEGNKRFLSQIWMAGSDLGRLLAPSRMEIELAKTGAKRETRFVQARHTKRSATQRG